MRPSTHDTFYQQGQAEFSRRFKNYLKQRRNWEVELQWGEDGDKDQTCVAVGAHTTVVILSLARKDVEAFGTAFQDKGYQKAFLEQKTRELVKKVQEKQQVMVSSNHFMV